MGESQTRTRTVESFIVVAMALATFGPYLIGGVRTEQAVIYGLSVIAIPLGLPFVHARGGFRLLIPWCALVAFSLMGVLFPSGKNAMWSSGGIFAGLDNYLLPLAVMLTLWCVVTPSSAEPLLGKVGKIIVWGMTLNAVLAIIDTRADLSGLLRPFWASEGVEETVASRALNMGRVSGIFNQPSAAGLVYSLAGLLAVYLYARQPRKLYLAVGIITVGGVLTVSKVFLLVGAPLILLYMWKTRAGSGKAGMLLAAFTLAGGVAQSGLLQDWDGVEMLSRTLNPSANESLISHYTAGRWAADSPMLTVIGEALRISPLVGVGAGGWSIAYDSSWTQAIVTAGLLGAACILSTLIGFFRLGKATTDPTRRRFTFFVATLLLAASVGLPTLTTNRGGAMVWIIVSLLVLAHREAGEEPMITRQRNQVSSVSRATEYRRSTQRRSVRQSANY